MKMNILSRRVRLMPAVIVVGTGLLVMKASGLVHEAQAAEASAVPASQPAQIDFAGPPEQNASASQVDILTNLSQRRDDLDARARDLDMRANLIAAAEKRVDDKIAEIKDLQTQLAALLKQRDAEQEKQIQALVKTYAAMKTASAAQIFASLDDDVLIPVAQAMGPEDLAKIMGAMPAEAAQKLTVKMANRLALPKTAVQPAAMAPVAAAPVPGQQSDATPQPATPDATQKQAALAPSPIDAKTPPVAQPVQVASKAPAAPAPVAAAKPATKVASTAKPQTKTDPKADAQTDTKTDAPADAAPAGPPAPAAPPGPGQ